MSVMNPLNPFNEQDELSAPEKELISTENTFCEQLSTLIEVFADPLTTWLGNLEADPRARQRTDYTIEAVREELEAKHSGFQEALFSNIHQLHDCSKELLSALEEASQNGSKNIVMDTFRRHAPFLTMYSSYTANFTSANMLLQRLQQDPRFSSFIKCGELQTRCKGLTLASFLILPVQRVPRYGLLIKEAMKMCSDENGVKLLASTLALTSNVTKKIDSKIEEEERRGKLVEVQNMLGIELLAPAREFIRDGSLTKICHSGRKDFYFVLCTDKLIYATESGGFINKKYSVNKNFDLHELLIVVPDDDEDQNKSFYVCSKDKAFEVEASSKEVCNQWVDDIVKLKTRRTVQQMKPEKPWYVTSEKSSGFCLYTIERGSVVVSQFRVHSGADLSFGIIGFCDIVPIAIDEQPSAGLRPPSIAGYKRMDSINEIQGAPVSERSDSMSSGGSMAGGVEPGERRSSFSFLKIAFCRQSPNTNEEKNRTTAAQRMSEPIPVLSFQPNVSVETSEQKASESNSFQQDDVNKPLPSGRPPLLKDVGRMNTEDFKLFGATGASPKGSPIQPSGGGKPGAPFVLKTKPTFDTNNFVPSVAPSSRPPIPGFTPPAASISSSVQTGKATGEKNPSPVSKISHAKSSSAVMSTHSSGYLKAGGGNRAGDAPKAQSEQTKDRPTTSTPLLRPPPPPAVERKTNGGSQAANRVVAEAAAARPSSQAVRPAPGMKPVKAATSKPDKLESRKSRTLRSNSDGSQESAGSKSISSTANSYVKASRVPPMLSDKRASKKDIQAMVDAVADAVTDTHLDAPEIAIGNVKCFVCDAILAYRMGSDPNTVVNQHMIQAHGLD